MIFRENWLKLALEICLATNYFHLTYYNTDHYEKIGFLCGMLFLSCQVLTPADRKELQPREILDKNLLSKPPRNTDFQFLIKDDFIFEEDIVSFTGETTIPHIKIYPNPVRNTLNISNLQQLQHIDIQSITGFIVWSEKFHGEEEVSISVSGFPDGIYFIKIISSDKLTIQKFIKN